MKKYRMPKGYLAWDKFLSRCDGVPSEDINYQMQKEGYANEMRDTHKVFIDSDSPVYCIKEDLINLFLKTDVFGDVPLFVDLQVSLPMFVVFFPKDKLFNPTLKGGNIKYLIISHINKGLSYEFSQYFGWSGLDDGGDLILGGRYIRKNGTYKPSSYATNVDSINKERNIQIFSVVAQILLCLQYYPEILQGGYEPEKYSAGSGFKKFVHESEYLYPRWLGSPKVIREKTANRSKGGSAKSSHSRKGHWRMQACGENYSNRKAIWIFPTFVLGGKI